jgi:hypothetical protein
VIDYKQYKRDAASQLGAKLGDATETLILWGSDEVRTVSAFAVPDAAITPALRAALEATPWCFAGPDDCGEGQWAAAVRVMAALNVHYMTPDAFYDAFVRDPGYGHEQMPSLEEIRGCHGSWGGCEVDDVAGRTFRGAYAFKYGM